MTRLHKITLALSLLIVAAVSGAWVIKDTANPVEIYTGSNTTPTISGATSGSVTLGPTAGGNLSHTFQSGAVTTAIINSGGTSLQRLYFNNGATTNWEIDSANAGPFTLYQGGSTAVGSVSSAGAWTLGPSGFGGTHVIRGGATFSGAVTVPTVQAANAISISLADGATTTVIGTTATNSAYMVNAQEQNAVTPGAATTCFIYTGAATGALITEVEPANELSCIISGSSILLRNNAGGLGTLTVRWSYNVFH